MHTTGLKKSCAISGLSRQCSACSASAASFMYTPQAAWGKTMANQHKKAICSFQPPRCTTLQEFPSSSLAGPSPPFKVRKPSVIPPPPSHTGPSPPSPRPSTTSAACGFPTMVICRQEDFCLTPATPQLAQNSTATCPQGHKEITAHSLSSGLGDARMALCFLFTSSTFSEILSMNPRISSTCGDGQDDRSPVRVPGLLESGGINKPYPKASMTNLNHSKHPPGQIFSIWILKL